jgi:hypothetical protein
MSQGGIDDQAWFELQFDPAEALKSYGIVLPALPPDEVQLGFTARAGRKNLEQAFSFYQHVCAVTGIREVDQPRILDFGAGWGRISRFFLRDTEPESIYVVDVMSAAVRWLHETGNPCNIIQNEPLPPIEGLNEPLDLAYAYSVFSHLSEEYAREWIDYLMRQLKPGGYLVFTTRGDFFIDFLEQLQAKDDLEDDAVPEHKTALKQQLPAAGEIRRRHQQGEFQFYPTGGAGELSSDFFGQAFIPQSYIEQAYGSSLVEFTETVPGVDQSVVVLQA